MMYDYLTKDENEVYDDNYNDWKIIIIYIYLKLPLFMNILIF